MWFTPYVISNDLWGHLFISRKKLSLHNVSILRIFYLSQSKDKYAKKETSHGFLIVRCRIYLYKKKSLINIIFLLYIYLTCNVLSTRKTYQTGSRSTNPATRPDIQVNPIRRARRRYRKKLILGPKKSDIIYISLFF